MAEDEPPPTLVFTALPDDVLRRIATCSGASAVVVACASRGAADQRLALRRGVDDFERARFGGRPGLTVREAAQLLDAVLAPDVSWQTRRAAGRHLATSVQYAPHMGGCTTELVERLLAYGASPNERVRAVVAGSNGHWMATPLHWAARFGHDNGLAVARALVAGGADIHAKVKNIGAGPSYQPRHTPLAWALASLMLDPFGGLSLGPIFGQRWAEEVCAAVAIYLLECGADAWEACRDLVAEVGDDGGELANLGAVGRARLHARAARCVTRDRARSREITRDRAISREMARDGARWREMAGDCGRSREIAGGHGRSREGTCRW